MMNDYDFILKFALPGNEADAADFVGKLEAAGCDDALIGIGKKGRIALDFTRSATSGKAAVVSAVLDVLRAIPGAQLIEAQPDLVGIKELANIFEFSRQNMLKIAATDRSFPAPVHEGKAGLFHLVEVLDWNAKNERAQIRGDINEGVLLEVAEANREVNLATQVNRLPNKALGRDIQKACEMA